MQEFFFSPYEYKTIILEKKILYKSSEIIKNWWLNFNAVPVAEFPVCLYAMWHMHVIRCTSGHICLSCWLEKCRRAIYCTCTFMIMQPACYAPDIDYQIGQLDPLPASVFIRLNDYQFLYLPYMYIFDYFTKQFHRILQILISQTKFFTFKSFTLKFKH